jgi:hypothetical protein
MLSSSSLSLPAAAARLGGALADEAAGRAASEDAGSDDEVAAT